MNQIEKLTDLETKLNNSNKIIKELEKQLNQLKKIQKDINELNKYYGSKEWYKDLEDYEKNKLKNINVGILSEDAIYDLINKNKELGITLLEIGTKIIKTNYNIDLD